MIRLLRHICIVLTLSFYNGYGQVSLTVDSLPFQKDSISETYPQFPGGMAEMSKFFNKNFKYPVTAKENGITGKCYVKFIVTNEGVITDIVVLRGVPNCNECDLEALRLFKLMPKWTPAFKNGVPVKTTYMIPLNFKMQ